jgi:RNA polymerase sigma-70 factor (ECF subfamily)
MVSAPPRDGGTAATVRARWTGGDREGAYALVVRETQDSLYRYLRHLLRDDEAAREVFQETYLRVFRGLGGFRGDASLTTWVLTVGRNLAFNRRRGEKVREARTVPLDDGDAHADPSAERDPAPGRGLLALVDALPEAQREAVVLYYVEDRSVADIAGILGRRANTVKSDLLRARTRLRETLEGEAAADRPRREEGEPA